MNKSFGLLLFLLSAVTCTVGAPSLRAAQPGRGECRTVPSKILGHPVAYCVILPRGYDEDKTKQYPVLYFLHGLGGNEQILVNTGVTNEVEDLRAADKIGEFLLVAPNAGRSFYIDSRNGKVRYEDFFITGFAPSARSGELPGFRWVVMGRCVSG